MKVIVYDSNGWIGNQFVKILDENCVEYKKGLSHVDNDCNLMEEIKNYNPTHGCIGDKKYTTIDYL